MTKQNDIAFFKSKIKSSKDLKERIRLCALLAKANNHPIKTIASILHISESTVYEYLNGYENEKKLKNKEYPGRECKLTNSQESELEAYLIKNSYESLKQLDSYIQEKYNIQYTQSGLRNWLKRKNLLKKLVKRKLFLTKI